MYRFSPGESVTARVRRRVRRVRRGKRRGGHRRCYRPIPTQKEPVPIIHLGLIEPDVHFLGVGTTLVPAAAVGIPGANCIKIGLPGKLILSKRKGLL